MTTITVIAIIAVVLFFIGKSILKQGGIKSNEKELAPQSSEDVQSSAQYKRISPEKVQAAKTTSTEKEQSGLAAKKLYKRVGIKVFDIKGISFRGLTPESDKGKFYGYIEHEKGNPHDKYAIGVYNGNGKHLGYTPKGNVTLLNEIYEAGGKIEAWGYLRHIVDNYHNEEYLCGEVRVPIRISSSESEKAKSEFEGEKIQLKRTM